MAAKIKAKVKPKKGRATYGKVQHVNVEPQPIGLTEAEKLKEKALEQFVEDNLQRVSELPQYPLSVMLITQDSDLEKTKKLFPSIPVGVEMVVVFSVPCAEGVKPHITVEQVPDDKYGSLTSIVNHFEGDFNFSQARNVGIDHCTRDWIMWVDSDDILTPSCKYVFEDLHSIPIGVGGIYAFLFGYQPRFGNMAEDFYAAKQVRIFRNHPQIRFVGTTHEQIILSITDLQLKCAHAPLFIEHFGYICDTEDMKAKIVRNLKGLAADFASGLTNPYHLQGVLDLLERDSSSYNKISKT